MRRRTVAAVTWAAVTVAAVLAACGDEGGNGAAPSTTAAPPVATTGSAAPAPRLDWTTRPALDAGGGWTATGCPGDGPFYCVSRAGRPAGTLELLTLPLASLPVIRGLQGTAALRAVAADAEASSRRDRERGCPAGSVFAALPPVELAVAGGPGLRYGFTVAAPGGGAAERMLSYVRIVGERLHLVTAVAFGPGSCVAPEGTEFEPATLVAFEPVLDRLAATMVVPA